MGVHNRTIVSFVFFIIVIFAIPKSFAFESCSDKIRNVCECFFYPFLTIRCSHKNLNEYPDLRTVQNTVQNLDASYNELQTFPPNLQRFFALETLDLSYNRIEYISNVEFPENLRHLILSYNNISEWINLRPNTFLESALNLETLNLAGNPLKAFNGADDRLLLISMSLKMLNLSDCQIHKITGSLMLSGLVNLEHLILSSNPLFTLPDLQSNSLSTLDVSVCKLTTLRQTVFSQMPMLTFVNFSGNYRISVEYVESMSLRQIDLSRCNMNGVELKGFPNLTTANLNGNLITELTEDTFQNNALLEHLELSSNAISRISDITFQWLSRLRSLDLSLNMIQVIETETFANNYKLTTINLSRNYLDRFRRFVSQSLTFLNLSRCEIIKVDEDALNDFPELIELDLSYNWFSELPSEFESAFLQILDLSRCRLSTIDNNTFSSFPELSRLSLAGNRLTTTLRKDFFTNNQYLNEIWLGDNPWHCECDLKSRDFFLYITERLGRPQRLKDRSQFRCYSPGNANGVLWEIACSDYWDGRMKKTSAGEKIWAMIMGILIFMIILYSVIHFLRWWTKYRREVREEQQRQEIMETTRELIRHNQQVLEQESQLNAPDPRETHPPCYDDAIRMPRLKSSFTSLKLMSFLSNDSDQSTRRATKRARSEEVLRSDDRKNERPILTARSRKNEFQTWIKNSGDSSSSMAGLISNNLTIGNSSSQKSFEIIAQLETMDGHSPYAKRRPQSIVKGSKFTDSSCESLNHQELSDGVEEATTQQTCNGINFDFNEIPHSSHTFSTSNPQSYSTSYSTTSSSSSSLESEDYIRLSRKITHSLPSAF